MNGSSEEPGKLFIGGLSWETTQDNLQRYFSRYGEVVDCVVMKNNETGRSRGFGFVTFKDPECVNVVLGSGPHELDGRTIDPKSCNPRGTTTSKVASSGKVRSTTSSSSKGGNYPKVFLGGLPSTVTETDLRSFFSKYGKVIEVVIMYDQERKKSRGFGFLSFDSEDCVDRVCLEHYVTVNGKQVECKRAEPRDASAKRSGGGGGGGNSMGGGGGGGWGNSGNMSGNSGGWGGPMGQGGNAGGPQGMANGMMGGYQGGWGNGNQQQQQQQQQQYQGGYGNNYQGWGTPSGFGNYSGAATGGTQAQYSQQGYSTYGYMGFNNAAGGQQQMAGIPTGNSASSGANDAYSQQSMQNIPGATQAAIGGNQQDGTAGTIVKSEFPNYDFGAGYSQGDGGGQQANARNTKTPYHPYQRS